MPTTISFGEPLKKSCAAESLMFGTSQKPSAGGATIRAIVPDMVFSTLDNELGAVLFQYCARGIMIKSCVITLRKDKTSPPYLTYTLADVYIGSVDFSGSGSQPTTATVSMNFAKAQVDYNQPPLSYNFP